MDKGQQRLSEDLYVQVSIHVPFKNANGSGSSHTNACSYMELAWMLWSVRDSTIIHIGYLSTRPYLHVYTPSIICTDPIHIHCTCTVHVLIKVATCKCTRTCTLPTLACSSVALRVSGSRNGDAFQVGQYTRLSRLRFENHLPSHCGTCAPMPTVSPCSPCE